MVKFNAVEETKFPSSKVGLCVILSLSFKQQHEDERNRRENWISSDYSRGRPHSLQLGRFSLDTSSVRVTLISPSIALPPLPLRPSSASTSISISPNFHLVGAVLPVLLTVHAVTSGQRTDLLCKCSSSRERRKGVINNSDKSAYMRLFRCTCRCSLASTCLPLSSITLHHPFNTRTRA